MQWILNIANKIILYKTFRWSSDFDCRCKMSTDPQDTPNNEDIGDQKECEDRVVTDSVHERFRQTYVHCDDCNRDVLGNEAAIRKHFNDLHPSDRHCFYCKGKVFTYRKITRANSRESSESFVYHKCRPNEQLEKNESKEPT